MPPRKRTTRVAAPSIERVRPATRRKKKATAAAMVARTATVMKKEGAPPAPGASEGSPAPMVSSSSSGVYTRGGFIGGDVMAGGEGDVVSGECGFVPSEASFVEPAEGEGLADRAIIPPT